MNKQKIGKIDELTKEFNIFPDEDRFCSLFLSFTLNFAYHSNKVLIKFQYLYI